MRYRKLDSDGDYSFGHGLSNFYIDRAEAVAQAVKTRLGLWVNEWFLDTDEGTDWPGRGLGKILNIEVRDSMIRRRILETGGVTKIVSFSSNYDGETRRAGINATIETIYGNTTINEEIQ